MEWIGVNPLCSNSDQRQISLRNINASSVREVMRIKDIITQHEFSTSLLSVMFGNKNGGLAVLMLEISNGNRTE